MMKMNDTYIVHCHRCGPSHYEPDGRFINPAEHPRNTSRMIGSSEWGALWHCPAHAVDCPLCPRGNWTDKHPDDPPPYKETIRHMPLRRI
jgi:hypothetical protein